MIVALLVLVGTSTPAAAQHAGHVMPPEPVPVPAPVDPHAGHVMPAPEPTPGDAPPPPIAPPPAAAFSGPEHAADALYDPAQMAAARAAIPTMHGGATARKIAVDRLEWGIGRGVNSYAWSGYGWSGGDIDRLWFKSEGEGDSADGLDRAEIQALWSHAVAPYWDIQAGVRQDVGSGPERSYAVIGVQGLAPYWFHVDAALFVSHRGGVSARVEAEHDLRLTQRLILQPRVEVNLAAQDVPALRIGSGLSDAEAGLRLRYHITARFAPYVGVEYVRTFGNSAAYARADGMRVGTLHALFGVRAWF